MSYEKALCPKDRAWLDRRDRIPDPTELDRVDRRARRAELRVLRLTGVREIRLRIAAVRAAKRAADPRPLSPAELDAILPPVDCRITRIRLGGLPPSVAAPNPRPEGADPP